MLLKRRIIPCVDVRAGRMAEEMRCAGLCDPGDPLEHAAIYEALGADEFAIFDMTSTYAGGAALASTLFRAQDRGVAAVRAACIDAGLPMAQSMMAGWRTQRRAMSRHSLTGAVRSDRRGSLRLEAR